MLLLLAILLGVGASLFSCMGLFGIDSNKEESTINDQKVSLNAGGFGTSASNITNSHIEYGDARVAEKALTVAQNQTGVALETVRYTLGALQQAQERGLHTVDAAVAASQGIAAKAAPVSAGDYAEAVNSANTKVLIVIAAIVGAVLIFRKRI